MEILDNILGANPVLKKMLEVLIILILTYCAGLFSTLLIKAFFTKLASHAPRSEHKKQILTAGSLVVSVIKASIFLFAAMAILAKFGINLKHIFAAAGVMGLVIGFGAKRAVEDVISGISILVSGQVAQGDSIKTAGISGVVEKVDLHNIVLRDTEGAVHYIRNSMVGTISCYSKNFSYAIFELRFNMDADINEITALIKKIGAELLSDKSNKMLEEPEIFGIEEFILDSFVFKFRVKTKPGKQYALKRTFNLAIKEQFTKSKIKLWHQ